MADFYNNDNEILFQNPQQKKYNQLSQEMNEISQQVNNSRESLYQGVIQEREQRAINQNKYGVDVPDEVYQVLNNGIANSDIPEETAYNMATAYKYSEMYGVPVEMAMENLDHFNSLTFGTKQSSTPKGNFEAVCDSWQIGKNTLKLANLGSELRSAEKSGDTELIANIEQQIALLEQENNSLADNQNRNFFIKALKDGAQTLPYSGAVAIPGILNVFLPGLGTAAAGVTSAELASSLEYVKLRQAGVTSDIARNISSVSGVVQGATEMALGTVAKSLGTNKLGKLVGSKTDDVVKSVLNKMHISNVALNTLGTALTNYAMDATEEGLEEALQEFESYVGLVIAEKIQDETDGQVQVPEVQEFVNDAIASFGAGFRSSLVLGGLSHIPQGVAKIADAEKLKQAAQTIPSKEEFINVTNNSPVFEGMTAEEKKQTQEEIYSTFEKQRNEILDTKAKDIEEVSDFQEGSENDKILNAEDETEDVRGKAYRTESGRLYTETDTKTDEKGNVTGTFKVGNPEEETSYNRYGFIKFTETSDNVVTIDSFKVTPGRQNLTVEMFEEFAEQNADKDIVWNPKGKLAKSLYKQLALNNPRGKEYGLSYYQDKSSSLIQDRQARVKLAKDIQKYFPNMNSQERAMSIAIFESIAKTEKKGLYEYINSTFKDGNPFADFSESGQKSVVYDEKGKPIYRLGAMTTFKNDGKSLIYTTQHSNFSTFVHEVAHVFKDHMSGDLLERAEKAFGVKNGNWDEVAFKTNDGRTISYNEALAEGFEDFLRTGRAKNTALKEIYEAIAQFMQRIYAYMQGERIKISKDIQEVYESMLSGESSLMNALSAVQQADESYQGKVKEQIKAEQEKKSQKETLTKQQEVEKIINDDTVAQQEKVTEVLNFVSEEELEKEYENLTEPEIPNFMFQTISDEGLERLLVDDPKLQQKHRLAKIAIENEYPSYYFSREDVPFSLIDGKLAYETDDKTARFTQGNIFNVLKQASNNRINEFYNAYLEKKRENKEESLKYLKNARLLKFAQENVSRQNFTLQDVLTYNDLYKAYPWLKSIPVRFISDAVIPLIDVTENEITINPVKGTLEEALTDLLVKTQLIINKTQALYNKDGSKFDAELDKNIQSIVDKYREKQEVIAKYDDVLNAVYESVDKNDIHYQVIGEIGAKALDIAEESNIRLDNLSIARQMKAQGKDPLSIRLATGWEFGVDEQWKYEIDDTFEFDRPMNDIIQPTMKFYKENPRYKELSEKMFDKEGNYHPLEEKELEEFDKLVDKLNAKLKTHLSYGNNINGEWTYPAYLEEVIDYPELFMAYPQLKKVSFSQENFTGRTERGYYSPLYNKIVIKRDFSTDELLHEIQHAIQQIEGFAKGGNSEQFNNSIIDNLIEERNETIRKIIEVSKSAINIPYYPLSKSQEQKVLENKEYGEYYKSLKNTLQDLETLEKHNRSNGYKTKFERYQSLAGEVEARNVQNRMYMSHDERIKTLLQDTADVAPVDQLVLFQSVSSEEFNAQSIEDVRKQYENTDKWLKAPNGNDTNLTEKQWLEVRTTNFKKWFGDWENDPENASKVVDENGEPLVVYHGTPLSRSQTTKNKGWQVDEQGNDIYVRQEMPFSEFKGGNYSGLIFFSEDYDKAKNLADKRSTNIPDDAEGKEQWTEEGYVFYTFLKSKKPYNVTTNDFEEILNKIENIKAYNYYTNALLDVTKEEAIKILNGPNSWRVAETPDFLNIIKSQGYDALQANDDYDLYTAVFSPNQIKSATDNSGEFSPENNSILFQEVEEASLNIPEKTKIDRDNFFKNTYADWKIAKTPDRQYDYKSASGSEYWYEKDGVYRRSNHWGNVASCWWLLRGTQYESIKHRKGLTFAQSKKEKIKEHEIYQEHKFSNIGMKKNDVWYENEVSIEYALTGFTKWEDVTKLYDVSVEEQAKRELYQVVKNEEDYNKRYNVYYTEEDLKNIFEDAKSDLMKYGTGLSETVDLFKDFLSTYTWENFLQDKENNNFSNYVTFVQGRRITDTVLFQTAYHGTPHNFDRFSTSAIGTGEGAQSFGWGLYFTNQEDIARWYADKLSPVKVKKEYYIIKDYIEVLYREVFINHKDFTGEKIDIEKTLERELEAKKDMGYPPYVIKDLENELNLFLSISDKEHLLTIIEPSRHLYTVELPDNGYLLWDKIVNNDELEKIKKALKEKGINDLSRIENLQGYQEQYKNNENATYTIGSNIYKVIADYLGSDKAASLFLRENGYIGIDYPANSLGGQTDKHKRNYVIFDENDVEITNHINYQTVDEDFLFQTEQELMKEAASFDTWQEFMEYYENPAFRPNNAHVPSDANASWYQKTWELAKGLVPTESLNREEYLAEQEAQTNDALLLDAMFLTELKNDNMLEPFLKAIAYFKKTDEWQPVDAEDNEELERFKRIKNRVEYEIRHASFITNATRVANGKPLTKRAKEQILSLIEKNARDYRSLYADIMYKDEYAVKLADTNKGKVKIASPDIDVDVMSPEQLKEIADKIEFEELAKKIKSGELLMDDELNRYINMLDSQLKESNKKLKEAEKAIEDERNEQTNDYKDISDWQQRQLLQYYDELMVAKGRLYEKDKQNAKLAQEGLELAEYYQKDFNRRKHDYDTIFKQFQDMKKITEITGVLKEAITRRDTLYEAKIENRRLKEYANALDETREIQKKLVRRAMRKVDFKVVDYDNAIKIIAIQEMFEPLLLEGLKTWIDTDNPYLKTVYYDYKTDTDFRIEMDTLVEGNKNKDYAFLINLMKTKNYDEWTPAEIKRAKKGLPKENYIRKFKLLKLGRERKGSVQIDLNSPEIQKMVKDVLPPNVYGALSKKFEKWSLNNMADLVEVIDDLYHEGKSTLLAKQEAKKEDSRKIRNLIEKSLKTGGIEIPPDATDEEKEKYQKLIDKRTQQILGYENVVQGTLDSQNNKNSLFNRLRHRGYADATILRVARILDGDKEGTNTDLLYYRADESYNSKHKNIRKRQAKIDKALIDNNIKVEELYKQITIPNLIDNKDTSFTIDELLFFLAANEDKPQREIEADEKIINALLGKDKKTEKELNSIKEKLEEEEFDGGSAYEAVVYGNMASNSEKNNLRDAINSNTLSEKDLIDMQLDYRSFCKARFERVISVAKQLDPKFLNFAKAIQEDYAVEFDRINKASIEEFNQPVWRVEKYIPLIRLGQSGDVNENRVKEDLLGTSGMQNQNWVNKGMTQKRIRINPWNQRPVETGLYKTWLDSVDRTEHFIAYSGYVRELNRIYKSRDANGNRGLMEAVFGKGMVRYIDDYINELANPTPTAQRTSLDKICRTLRGKTAPAYLAWKMSGIIKQFCTSPWPYLQYINPIDYIKASFGFIKDYNNMSDSIKNKSVFMNSRTMDPVIDLIKEEQLKVTNKTKAGLNKFNSIGMQGLEFADWMCVAPGWLAVYEKEHKKLTSEIANQEKAREDAYKNKLDELIEENEKLEYFAQKTMEELQEEAKMDLPHVNTTEEIEELAVRKADDITRRCQPSSRVEDLSPLFKNSGKNSELVKILLQFQTSLNVIWNNIRYDLPQAVKDKEYKQIIGAIAGYTMAGIMVTLVTGGPYGDEDDEEETKLLKQIMFGATTQFTDSVPVLGSYITTLSEMLITGEGGMMYSNNTFPVLNEAMATVQSASKGKWDKAAINFAEGVGYFLGLPVSGTKELLESAGLRDDEEGAEFKPGAFLGWR